MEKSGSRSFTLSWWWPFVLGFLVLCFCGETCNARDDSKSSCTSSCGLIHNITYPFRLNDDPKTCGDTRYTLSCENNNTTVLDLPYSGKYHVQAINYKNQTVRLLDPGLDNNNCSSLPQNWPPNYFPYPYTYGSPLSTSVYYLRCRNQVNSSLYVDTAPCLNNSATSLIQPKSYSYVMVHPAMEDLNEGCTVERKASMLWYYYNASYSYEYIHSALMYGFELRVHWPDEQSSPCNGSYYFVHPKCYPRTIPGFFQYEWAQIPTIGRIHHANVVRLVGYCVEGSKRALVYEFMANGSLDKYIYSKEGSVPLTIDKMYEISLGVAQGIEYLHQGCAMQILHFDIKPHNILLDENFKAKVSDFGLAKLYPVDNSIVTLTREGYNGIYCSELFYKTIGGVSHKADVYSLNVVDGNGKRRKNLNTTVEHSSQIYFPLWVYDQYNVGNDLEMDNVTEEEKNVIKKMVITALWCIQMKPTDHPSMHKVIEMLEGDVECLQMPPRPSLCPQETPVAVGDIQDPICSNVEITCSLAAR